MAKTILDNNVGASTEDIENDIKIALGTAALNLSALEWISGKYSTFICEKLHASANDLELCATYIYVGASQAVADNKVNKTTKDIDIAEQYVSPDLINKLAENNNALMRFSKEITDNAANVDLTTIVIPAFEISFLWLEQLTNNIINDTMKNTCTVSEISDIDTNAFIYSYIGLTDGIACVDELFGAGTLNKMLSYNVNKTSKSATFYADSLAQAKEWYASLSKKKKKSFSFNDK